MKVENLRVESNGGKTRAIASVVWEDCERGTYDVYFETDDEFARGLSCNPNAFLIACAIPAMHYGEQRILVDGAICPELRIGLITAMGWIRHWYEPHRELPRIEAKVKTTPTDTSRQERAGLFLSGGIDSFSALRFNRLSFPMEHPWSVKDALVVYGLEMDAPESFVHVLNSLSKVTSEAHIELIPVYTNLYLPYRQEDAANGFFFWWNKFMGGALAAVAHSFTRRLTVVSIASDYDIAHQRPHGSHPLLDPNYSSIDLRIRHDGLTMSRFAKTKLVADWDVALRHIRVCNMYKLYGPESLNCGECEKCLRTMLALLALGALEKTNAFSDKEISEELLRSRLKINDINLNFYEELVAPLSARGHHDLVTIIKRKSAERNKKTWKERVKEFDSKYLKNSLVGLKRRVNQQMGKAFGDN
jgi:hypothetical protein